VVNQLIGKGSFMGNKAAAEQPLGVLFHVKHQAVGQRAHSFSLISRWAKPIISLTPPLTEEDTVKANKLFLLALSLFPVSVFSFVGCASEGKIVNAAPSELTLTADKFFVVTGGTIRLQGHATDTDGDSLIYSWKASGASGPAGSFDPSATGAAVSWIAPSQPGPVTITMTVSDEIEKASKKQDVTVCVRFPSPVRASKTIVNAGHVYIITDALPVRIVEGVTLTIDPGVTIVVDSQYGGFEAFGRIVAEGKPNQKIRITNNAVPWEKIDLSGPSAEAIFKHAEISGALGGIQADEQATLTLDSCTIYSNVDVGISVLNSSVATIHACKVWDNGTGIYVLNSTVDIRESSIRYTTANGIELSASQSTVQVVIEDCEIANHNLDCIVLKEKAFPSIHHNSIYSSGEIQDGGKYYAIRLLGGYSAADSVEAESNFWGIGNNSEAKIGSLIFDQNDSPAVGAYVRFSPWLENRPIQQELTSERSARGRAWERLWR
jgi:hypothetical protein